MGVASAVAVRSLVRHSNLVRSGPAVTAAGGVCRVTSRPARQHCRLLLIPTHPTRPPNPMAYLAPAEFVTKVVDAGESKLLMSTRDTLIRAYMAGAILALAAAFAVTVTVNTGNPLVGALLFPVGFCLLYLMGYDLLTGVFTLAPLAVMDKRHGATWAGVICRARRSRHADTVQPGRDVQLDGAHRRGGGDDVDLGVGQGDRDVDADPGVLLHGLPALDRQHVLVPVGPDAGRPLHLHGLDHRGRRGLPAGHRRRLRAPGRGGRAPGAGRQPG